MTKDNASVRLRRVLALGLAVAFVIQNTVTQFSYITETRAYRDLVGQTPFYDVLVTEVIIKDKYLITAGEMKKRRCSFDTDGNGLVGHIGYADSPYMRVAVNTQPEDTLSGLINRSRPASSVAENWGYWILTNPIDKQPISWEIIAGHWCPIYDKNGNTILNPETNEPVLVFETNLFASGLWENTEN